MAGHNKWSSIKHKKGAKDKKRAKIFTKLIKEITVAARMGGGDPGGNPRLRLALSTARTANMPRDNIERAIKKGTGELEGVNYEEVTYEGYGPSGVAILVQTLTDNTNRTVSEVRSTFSKRGGNLGAPGSVAWMFEEKGLITIPTESTDFETLFEAAVEAGAEDVQESGEQFEIVTDRTELYNVSTALEQAEIEAEEAKLAQIPTTTVELTETVLAQKILTLIEALEDLDDVQEVFANFDVSESVANDLGSE
jgi:YebC/PmpR family DNA-binding regulatory protein